MLDTQIDRKRRMMELGERRASHREVANQRRPERDAGRCAAGAARGGATGRRHPQLRVRGQRRQGRPPPRGLPSCWKTWTRRSLPSTVRAAVNGAARQYNLKRCLVVDQNMRVRSAWHSKRPSRDRRALDRPRCRCPELS